MFFVLMFSYTFMRKCIRCPKQGESLSKTMVWQVILCNTVGSSKYYSKHQINTQKKQTLNGRGRDPSKPPQHSAWRHLWLAQHQLSLLMAQQHVETSTQILQAGWVWGCGSRAKGAALCGTEMLTQQPSICLHQWFRDRRQAAAAGGQCPDLCMQEDNLPWQCMSSAELIGKNQSEVMNRRRWATMQGTNKLDTVLLPAQPKRTWTGVCHLLTRCSWGWKPFWQRALASSYCTIINTFSHLDPHSAAPNKK